MSKFYRPDIDGLRAVAVLSVIAYHLNNQWLPGGYTGVDVFFVISGFVVAASLAMSQQVDLVSFLAEFYARRLARILPALVTVLTVTSLAATMFIPQAWLSELSERVARFAFFGLSNLVMQNNGDAYFSPRAEFNPYTHTWSLGVEEQYYVIAPFFLYAWLKANRSKNLKKIYIAIFSLIFVAISSLGYCIWSSSNYPAVSFYSIASRFWELSAGALLFVMTGNSRNGSLKLGNPSPATCYIQGLIANIAPWLGAGLIVIGLIFSEKLKFPWPWAILPVTGVLLVIGGASIETTNSIKKYLSNSIFVWIGKRSYSLYLWHWPVFVLMRWTVGLESFAQYCMSIVLTFLLGILSYEYVERPFRYSRWVSSISQSKRLALYIGMAVLGFFLANHFFDHRGLYGQSVVTRFSDDWYPGRRIQKSIEDRGQCSTEVELHDLAGIKEIRYIPINCSSPKNIQRIFVLGDSHAGMLGSMLEELSADDGVEVSLFSFPGCNYINFIKSMGMTKNAVSCGEYSKKITQYLIDNAASGDLVVLSTLRLQRYVDQWASFNIVDMYEYMYNADAMKDRAVAFEEAKFIMDEFSKNSINVMFVAPMPVFKIPPFRCSDWFNRSNPICSEGGNQVRSDLEKLREPVLKTMQKLKLQHPSISIWDPFRILCPEELCTSNKNGRPLFFDGDHLSTFGASLIYNDFKKNVNRVIGLETQVDRDVRKQN